MQYLAIRACLSIPLSCVGSGFAAPNALRAVDSITSRSRRHTGPLPLTFTYNKGNSLTLAFDDAQSNLLGTSNVRLLLSLPLVSASLLCAAAAGGMASSTCGHHVPSADAHCSRRARSSSGSLQRGVNVPRHRQSGGERIGVETRASYIILRCAAIEPQRAVRVPLR